MAIPNFPIDPDQTVGRFWAAGAELGEHSDGVIRVQDRTIELDVAKPLTPSMIRLDEATPGLLVRAQEEGEWVIHGNLPINSGGVTLLGVRTLQRWSNVFRTDDFPELHRVRADWCIAGAHVEGPQTLYSGVRARFTHLELWAKTSGLEVRQQIEPELTSTYQYIPPQPVKAPFGAFQQTAELKLHGVATIGAPSVWGGQISTASWLELDGLDGWTLEELLARFVTPVEVLLTSLAGEKCDLTHLEVKVEDKWCPVYGVNVHPNAKRPRDEPLLLGRSNLKLDLLSTWCDLVARLSPAPHIVASSTAGTFSTLPSEALVLATTAEGLDRALYPDSRRLSEEDVEAGVAGLKESPVPPPVRQVLIDSLALYLFEDSYPKRMKRLAKAVRLAAPDVIGNPGKWATEITNMRVALAHALGTQTEPTNDELLQMYGRVLSLRWAMLVRLLLEAGLPAETLGEALTSSKRYQDDVRRWRRHMPKVFTATG